jgi:hypothetical protein
MGGATIAAPSGTTREDAGANVLLAGGIAPEQRGMRVQDFVSAYCQARIHRVLPGQFLDMTIAEVMSLAKTGDAAARRCLKLLRGDEHRK